MLTCNDCNTSFTRQDNLTRHACISKVAIKCVECTFSSQRRDNVIRHLRLKHGYSIEAASAAVPKASRKRQLQNGQHCSEPSTSKKTCEEEESEGAWFCDLCTMQFETSMHFAGHRRSEEHKRKLIRPVGDGIQEVAGCFENRIVTYRIIADCNVADIHRFLRNSRNKVTKILTEKASRYNNIKFSCELYAYFIKNGGDDAVSDLKSFNSKYVAINTNCEVESEFDVISATLKTKSEEFTESGSGWSFHSVAHLDINTAKYTPIRGSSYIDLPSQIKMKRACINIQNNDEMCLAWSITAALHPTSNKAHRVTQYPHYGTVLDLSGVEFPCKLKDLPKIEELNALSLNVYGLEYCSSANKYTVVGPIFYTKNKRPTHINLLLIEEGRKSHYVLIKDMSKLISKQVSKSQRKQYLCDGCLIIFNSEEKLLEHNQNGCNKIHTIMPTPELKKDKMGNMVPGNITKFDNFSKRIKVPFVIYADFQCLFEPIQTCRIKNGNSSNITHSHSPYSFAYKIKCSYDSSFDKIVKYTGQDCSKVFLDRLTEDVNIIYDNHINKQIPMHTLSELELLSFNSAIKCHICEGELLSEDKVSHHCHLTGKFVGAAHSVCNISYKTPNFIPIFVHNFSQYSHLFIKEFANDTNNIDIIPENKDKYISIIKPIKVDEYINRKGVKQSRYIRLRFLDSFRFMAGSLEKLATNLNHDQLIEISRFSKSEDEFKLLRSKGVFPCEYVDSIERLQETRLPPREVFYSSLANVDNKMEDYEHARKVWNQFQCSNMSDYSDLHLTTNILLLTDIFEAFRSVCIKTYDIDPAQYYTAPGLSWDAMLKHTKIKLELLTDIEMHNFISKGIRGGICQCSLRYAEANNKYMPDYDATKPSSYLAYWDANNLYGWAMSQYLPYKGFKWLSRNEIEHLNVASIADEASIGYMLEVDLEYPQSLHNQHNDLPFLPENITPPGPNFKNSKLIPTLNNKSKYILHYRNLKQVLLNGLKLKQIHRVISFQQSDFLKTYIDLNTTMRQAAKNNFEKDFYKLMNNSVFGKSIENVNKRVDVKLITHWDDIGKRRGAQTLIAKPNFKSVSIFNENFAAIQLERLNVLYDKPIYIGFSVLDLSKLLIYDFFYNFLKPLYGDNVTLCYMDTDSLTLSIQTDDVYLDMRKHLNKFDTSNFAPDNIYNIPLENKAVLGLMKDENAGAIMTEFVGLRAKMYANRVNNKWNNKAKGVNKYGGPKHVSGHDFKNCLFNSELISITQNKLALSPHDDKRYICENRVNTLAWGHCDIPI